jgi:hypothetical protein
MGHPPIPPKSICFGEGSAFYRPPGPYLAYFPCYGEEIGLYGAFDPRERLSIAAVAEVEWCKEAEKWANLPVNDCKNFDQIAQWKAEAESNARAWRVWGST